MDTDLRGIILRAKIDVKLAGTLDYYYLFV